MNETKEQDDKYMNNFLCAFRYESVDDYIENHEKILSKITDIEKIANSIKVVDDKKYHTASNLKEILVSIYCYLFNNNRSDEVDKIVELENKIGKKMKAYVTKCNVKDIEAKKLARFLLSGKYLNIKYNYDLIFEKLNENDMLRVKNDTLVIIGLHHKIGDNVFTVGNGGREYRQYVGCCCFQAIGLYSFNHQSFIDFLKEKGYFERIKPLEDKYDIYGLGDGKYCIRPFSISKKDKEMFFNRGYIEKRYCCYYP